MADPAGEPNSEALRLDFDRRLMLQFRGSVVTSDAGLLAYRELDDALGLSETAGERLADARTGKNGRHALVGMSRQAVFGRLPDTRTSTTPSGCAMIPRYDGSSVEGRLMVVRPRRARWGVSRRDGSRPQGTCRRLLIIRPIDRQGSSPPSAQRRRARHGFERQPDPRRTGNERLGWALRMLPCYHRSFTRASRAT